MNLDKAMMVVMGVMVLVSALLTMYISGSFIYLTLFVGFMILQTAFTGFCPARMVLKALGVKE